MSDLSLQSVLPFASCQPRHSEGKAVVAVKKAAKSHLPCLLLSAFRFLPTAYPFPLASPMSEVRSG